ncbi:MAG TPA: hypothetical protein VGQ52_20560 [Gemmatimonadaceae bacterium]|nr:hypothetical protein [Gemmatimonadaceae bacterium]
MTFLYQVLGGARPEAVIHAMLALGALLVALATVDFRTPRWITLLGAISAAALAVIFVMQGLSELIHNQRLSDIVFRVLGQRIEGWLVDLFLLWCVAVWLRDSRGRTKAFGAVVLGVAVGVEIYANWLAFRGTSLNAVAPMLKLVVLPPFVWLLLESKKARNEVSI